MSSLSPIANLKNLKTDMENMSYKEKWIHIWTYYRWLLIVAVILAMLVSILLGCISNIRKITLLGGVTVNVQLTEEGRNYLTEEYKQLVGTGNDREQVYLSYMDIGAVSEASSDNYYAVMSLLALCTNEELDYLILNQTGFETMLIQGAYLELDQVYSPEELEAFGDKLIYATQKDATEPTAMALDISDCAFIQEHTSQKGPIYFVYVASSPRVDACKGFCEYLLNYKPE